VRKENNSRPVVSFCTRLPLRVTARKDATDEAAEKRLKELRAG
jgi:hypothetical protein